MDAYVVWAALLPAMDPHNSPAIKTSPLPWRRSSLLNSIELTSCSHGGSLVDFKAEPAPIGRFPPCLKGTGEWASALSLSGLVFDRFCRGVWIGLKLGAKAPAWGVAACHHCVNQSWGSGTVRGNVRIPSFKHKHRHGSCDLLWESRAPSNILCGLEAKGEVGFTILGKRCPSYNP
jgi:hypothetical protein